MMIDDKLLKHLAIFCENVLNDINEHLDGKPEKILAIIPTILTIPAEKIKETKKLEDDIIGQYPTALDTVADQTLHRDFFKSKISRRKIRDTAKFTINEYRWIKEQRAGPLSGYLWQDFADRMNQVFNTSKTKNTWANIVQRNTAYLRTLDY